MSLYTAQVLQVVSFPILDLSCIIAFLIYNYRNFKKEDKEVTHENLEGSGSDGSVLNARNEDFLFLESVTTDHEYLIESSEVSAGNSLILDTHSRPKAS